MKKMMKLIALIAVFALLLTACGAKEAAPAPAETNAAPQESVELGLSSWTMTASIWSSANGAAVDLTAVPVAWAEGMTANFVVRLEGEDISNNPCEWNGTALTSSADLNAEDGYCYYVVLTGPDGAETTVEVNTPNATTDDSLINLASSIVSYCSTTISDTSYENEILTINQGTVTIQVPTITTASNGITCTSARLILNLDGGALAQTELDLPAELNDDGCYAVDLVGITFAVPEMEGDHQLTLALTAELSDGQTLQDESTTYWLYSEGELSMTVG